MAMAYDWILSDGRMAPAAEPLPRGDGDVDKEIAKLGYTCAQQVGDDCGLSYGLYDLGDSGPEGLPPWLVVLSTPDLYFNIQVRSLPDLIDLLAKLSVITLAGMFDRDSIDNLRWLLEMGKAALIRRAKGA